MANFIALARDALSKRGCSDVAAVLAAAAFDDAVRRLAACNDIAPQEDLSDTLRELKKRGVLNAGEIDIAESCMSFLHNAIRGRWNEVGLGDTIATLAFAEEIIRNLAV